MKNPKRVTLDSASAVALDILASIAHDPSAPPGARENAALHIFQGAESGVFTVEDLAAAGRKWVPVDLDKMLRVTKH